MKVAKLKARAQTNFRKNSDILVVATLMLITAIMLSHLIGTVILNIYFGGLLVALVLAFILPGYTKLTYAASKSRKTKFEYLFSEKKLFLKCFGMFLVISIIMFILYILEMIAFKSLVSVLIYHAEIGLGLSIVLGIFGILLSAAILFVMIYIMITLSQTMFILIEEPKLSIREILSKSFNMMAEYAADYFLLILSFVPWLILGIFTLGILYLWLFPYIAITLANFYQVVKREYKKLYESEIEKLPNDNDQKEATK